MMTQMHVNRRDFAFAAAAVLAAIPAQRGALAQDEIPTTGARRPGPIVAVASGSGVRRGVTPVAIQIAKAGVDAPIETGAIIDGMMQDPTGPWVVAWYDDLAALGEGGNAVMAGHVDYWDTGPAVFYNLVELVLQRQLTEKLGKRLQGTGPITEVRGGFNGLGSRTDGSPTGTAVVVLSETPGSPCQWRERGYPPSAGRNSERLR